MKYDAAIFVALITAAASIVVAALSYLFAKTREKDQEWRKIKFEYYQEFMAALSSVVGSDATADGYRAFAKACNTIQLVASPQAIKALHEFREGSQSPERERELRSRLIRELRADLGASAKDNPIDLRVRLYESGVKKSKR